MSDRDALLAAIRANPDDDTARLVFADWLDERDDPLGQFIRVQVELEPVRYRIDNPRAVELHAREDELLRRYRDEWVGEVPPFPNPADFGPVFRRGLPDYACLSLDTFISHGEALFRACPTLREVALYGVANRGSDLTLSPLLAKLDTLEIADWLTEDDAVSLSVSPHLDRISRFKLWLGGEPHFLRELVKQASKTWPRDIELVQVYGGIAAGERAQELNAEADALVREANEQLRREAVRVTRPFESLFPIAEKAAWNIYAGRSPTGLPALAAGNSLDWLLVTFKEDGTVREVTIQNNPLRAGPEAWKQALELPEAFGEWVNEELRLECDFVRVREFAVEGFRVELWPAEWHERFADSPSALPVPEEDGPSSLGGQMRGWLEQQQFCIGWVGCGADWRGKVCLS